MGRCSSGMNRTSKGEIVTEHNVWLGNVYGLVTKPISEWEKSKESQPGCWGFEYIYGVKSEQLNPYNVVCLQAKNYVTDNTLLLVQICTDIIDNLEK